MSLVFAGVCSHAPGITGRKHMAEPDDADTLYAAMDDMREAMEATRPDALIVIAAEHFANFFMDNMPAYCMGMAEEYEGPIEDPAWLGIERTLVPGNPDLSRRLIEHTMQDIDLAYAQEWKFDHGIMVPLHFLTPRYDLPIIPVNINCQGPPITPLHRAWAFGQALRKACDAVPERIAIVGTGGISHWPATPTPARSTPTGIATSSIAGAAMTASACWSTATNGPTWKRAGAALKYAHLLPYPAQPPAAPALFTTTARFPFSPWAAPLASWTWNQA